jgi:hypothetical protein
MKSGSNLTGKRQKVRRTGFWGAHMEFEVGLATPGKGNFEEAGLGNMYQKTDISRTIFIEKRPEIAGIEGNK